MYVIDVTPEQVGEIADDLIAKGYTMGRVSWLLYIAGLANSAYTYADGSFNFHCHIEKTPESTLTTIEEIPHFIARKKL